MEIDRQLLLILNGLAGSHPLLEATVRLLVNDYFVPTTLCLLLLAFWFEPAPSVTADAYRRAVLQTVTAILIANLLVKLFNLVYFRPRPYFDQEVTLLFYRPADSSFPSNPAAVAFAFAATIWPYHRRLAGVMGILASLFSLARVFAGVHYPLDILVGSLLGVLAARISLRLDARLHPIYDSLESIAQRLGLG